MLKKTLKRSFSQAVLAGCLSLFTFNLEASGPRISYADSVVKAVPAVVSIRTAKLIPMEMNPLLRDPFFKHLFGLRDFGLDSEGGYEELQGLGSGVIVDSKGHILTNNHVIKDVDSISVVLGDGRKADAKVIGSDPDTDLAVLKIESENLPTISLGNSSTLKVGDVVLAIGNPTGVLDQTVTMGIVSATQRSYSALNLLCDLIQTDAAINPGNSGGALVDTNGELIGINTAIVSQSGGNHGIGFAVPIDVAKNIMEQLKAGKKITRGWLGIVLQELTPELRQNLKFKGKEGIHIRSVMANSPAYKAGLLPGDIVTKIGDEAVSNTNTAVQLVAKLVPGKTAYIEVFRKGDLMRFAVQIMDRKEIKNKKPRTKPYSNKSYYYGPENDLEQE